MSVLQQIEAAGLTPDFDAAIEAHLFKEGDVDTIGKIKTAVDSQGLRHKEVMKFIAQVQQKGNSKVDSKGNPFKLKTGLYKKLVKLDGRVADFNETSGAPAPESTTTTGGDTVSDDNVTELSPEGTDPDGFSDKDEAKFKAMVAKEEERAAKRLLNLKAKMKKRVQDRDEKKAQKQGMQLEQMQAIKVKKDELTKVSEEIKVLQAKKKIFRDELKALKPQRKKKGEQKAS